MKRIHFIKSLLLVLPLLSGCLSGSDDKPVVAKHSPVFVQLGNPSINEGETLRFNISATDPDGDSVIYSMPIYPQGAILTGNAFEWTPSYSQSGGYLVEFIATDTSASANKDTLSISIDVLNINRSPILDSIKDTTALVGSEIRLTLSATDPDGDSLRYSLSNGPSGTNLLGNIFTWTPSINQVGQYILLFQAFDNGTPSLSDNTSAVFTVREKTCSDLGDSLAAVRGNTIPYFTVIRPNGGETYHVGDSLRIRVIGNRDISNALVKLFVGTPGSVRNDVIPNLFSSLNVYQNCDIVFVIPSVLGAGNIPLVSDSVKVRVEDYTQGSFYYDLSDGYFRILP